MKRLLLVPVLAALVAAGAACGDTNKVGSQGLLNVPSPSPIAIPSPSPSPSPAHVAAPPPVQHQPPPPVATVVTVTIITNSPYITPQNLKIAHGTVLKFVNQDTQPDKVEIVNGAGNTIASQQISPGGSWSYTMASPGAYQLTDRRPYATDSVTVT
jgi:hypothetical protein